MTLLFADIYKTLKLMTVPLTHRRSNFAKASLYKKMTPQLLNVKLAGSPKRKAYYSYIDQESELTQSHALLRKLQLANVLKFSLVLSRSTHSLCSRKGPLCSRKAPLCSRKAPLCSQGPIMLKSMLAYIIGAALPAHPPARQHASGCSG